MPNTLTLTGRLAADPEFRFSPSGDAVVSGRVADTPRHKNRQTGEWEDGETKPVHCKAAPGRRSPTGSDSSQ